MRKKVVVIIILLVFYLIFVIYNNINLMKDREYEKFEHVNISGDIIVYDKIIQKVAEPLFFERGEKAVLLLHGFGGTPVEVKELAEFLASNDITVYAPLLVGHGTNLKELAKIKWQDEYEDAKQSLDILKKHYGKVYVGGLCTGGLLALALAEKETLDGVISMSSPVFLSSKVIDLITCKLFLYPLRIVCPYLRRIEYGMAKDPEVIRKVPSNDRFPVSGLITVDDLTNHVRSNLNKINERTLIIQSKFDNRASPASADYIYDKVENSEPILWLENSGHVVTMDYDKEKVFRAVLEFIKEN
jgi:carboxylesterase